MPKKPPITSVFTGQTVDQLPNLMSTFLSVVSPSFPENYEIGVHAWTWDVEGKYKKKIGNVARFAA